MRIAAAVFLVAAILSFPLGSAAYLRSTVHSIDCWDSHGNIVRHHENDPRGPYYSRGGDITFLDPTDGKMTRLSSASCIEKWDANYPY